MSEITTNPVKEEAKTSGGFGEILGRNLSRFLPFVVVIVLFVVFSITAKNFFTLRSVLSLALQTSTVTLMGIGVTFAIITGGIDLSIGSVVALTGTVAVMVAIAGVPIWLSMIIGVLVGVFTGLLNGLMVTRLKLPPFIATLGMMMLARRLWQFGQWHHPGNRGKISWHTLPGNHYGRGGAALSLHSE